jgi:prepilin-type N-terminal cleavage/methylation domain-containing protein
MSRLGREDGFTLVELLVGAMLMLIIASASLGVLDQFRRMSTRTDQRVELQDKARQASRTLARSLRNIAPSPEFPTVIERAGSFDLVFRAVDRPRASGANTQNLKRVRYCLDASDPDRARILEQTQRWNSATAPPLPGSTSCTTTPTADWGTPRVVADLLTNRSGAEDRPLWSYEQTSSGQITAVKVNLFMNDEPETRVREVALQTGVYLRNQNRAPSALFTAAPAGVRHVVLNGSTSSDPEGDPLDYSWFVNGVEVGRGLIYDYAAPSGGTYELRLDVRDPSGLLGRSPTQTVVLP